MAYRREERCKRGKKKGTSSWGCDVHEEERGGEAEQEPIRVREHHLRKEGVTKRHYALWGVAGFAEQAGWFKMRPEQVAGPFMH